jgi:hypothetical protein
MVATRLEILSTPTLLSAGLSALALLLLLPR